MKNRSRAVLCMRKKSRAKDWAPVSVIVHNFKGTNKLERCLSSIVNSDYPMFEIIVVDGLTEGIEDWLHRQSGDSQWSRNPEMDGSLR